MWPKAKKESKWRDAVKSYVKNDNLEALNTIFANDKLSAFHKLWVLAEALEFCCNQRDKYCDLFVKSYTVQDIQNVLKVKVQNSPINNSKSNILTKIEASFSLTELLDIHANIRTVLEQYRDEYVSAEFQGYQDADDMVISELATCVDSSDLETLRGTLAKGATNIWSKLWMLEKVLKFYHQQYESCCNMFGAIYSVADIHKALSNKIIKSHAFAVNKDAVLEIISTKSTIEDLVKESMKIRIIEKQHYDSCHNQDESLNIVGEGFYVDTSTSPE